MTSPKLLLPLALAVALGAATPAGATTFCVPGFSAACPDDGANVAEPDLSTASGLQSSDGEADRIVIAPGDLHDADGFRFEDGDDPLEIVGAGAATRLTATTPVLGRVVNLGSSDRDITLRDLEVVIPAGLAKGTGYGVWANDDTLDGLTIESLSPHGTAVGAIGSTRVRNTTTRPAGTGTLGNAIYMFPGSGTTTADGLVATDVTGSALFATAGTYLVVRRSRIDVDEGRAIVLVPGGGATVSNTLITSRDLGIRAWAKDADGASMALDQVTLLGHSGAVGPAIDVEVSDQATADSLVTLSNSIVNGFAETAERRAPVGAATGDANLRISYSSAWPFVGTAKGDGEVELAPGNVDGDPQLASDFGLLPGSPAIDAGSPGGSGLPLDLLGTPRLLDGDGDGVPRLDMGAFEHVFVPQPPATTSPDPAPAPATTTTPAPQPQRRSGDAGDAGDRDEPTIRRLRIHRRLNAKRAGTVELTLSEAATVRLTLLKIGARKPVTLTVKGKAGRNRISVRKLPRGAYRLTARAVDAAGNASAAARLKVRVAPR